MSFNEKKAAIRRFWEEVFNKRKLELIDGLFTEDYIYHGAAGQDIHGREGLKQFLAMYFNAFPDLYAEVEDVFGEGDKIASRAMCRGTHKGDLMGMPPTGKQIAIRVICTNRFSGSKIAEDWELPDLFGMMQQLGAMKS
ncbi:MAG TPA: ester cyclase [Dehalococcoidia bacterium]|nr:ester cyclase [Dehalococcoidia bacterium]